MLWASESPEQNMRRARHRTEWLLVIGRFAGALVLLTGLLLTAHLCSASSPADNPIPSIFDTHSTPADSIRHLSFFVLVITGLIFLVVFTLLTYVVVKFRSRATDITHEPAQVYGSTQIELAWTVIPILIVVVLFVATASAPSRLSRICAESQRRAARSDDRPSRRSNPRRRAC